MSHAIQGREVGIPVEVRDASAWTAVFVVPAAPVAAHLAPAGLEPAAPLPRKAVVTLAVVRYLDTDLGPYHELAVAFLARPASDDADPASGSDGGRLATRDVGAYIHWLPVNQAFTLAAGRDIWGFPKELARIDVNTSCSTVRARVEQDGRLVCELALAPGVPMPARSTAVPAWSWREGVLRRTPWTLDPSGVRGRPGGARLVLGDHPRAQELRALGLPRRAVLSTATARMRARFDDAQVVATADRTTRVAAPQGVGA